MNKNLLAAAERADFCFWEDESWGPGPGNIDWSSSDYSKELEVFAKEILLDFYRNHFDINGEDISEQIRKYTDE